MNNFNTILSNQWFQIAVIILLFWFLFLREDFTDVIPTVETCERCDEMKFNDSNMSIKKFKNKCTKLDGTYVEENKSCKNYKSNLDSYYKCNCEIK
jgi:hypothetical protein